MCCPRFMVGADGQENIPHSEWVATFDQVVKEVKAEMTAKGRGDEFYGARVQGFFSFACLLVADRLFRSFTARFGSSPVRNWSGTLRTAFH